MKLLSRQEIFQELALQSILLAEQFIELKKALLAARYRTEILSSLLKMKDLANEAQDGDQATSIDPERTRQLLSLLFSDVIARDQENEEKRNP